MKEQWLKEQIPELQGRSFLVTGANSGLGLATSRMLAFRGALVYMACRNRTKAEEARKKILELVPRFQPVILDLDLSSLDSIRKMADSFNTKYGSLDVLINNAGLMGLQRGLTAEGFELQMGVNHFGHFALAAELWPSLSRGREPGIVQIGSLSHQFGRIRFDDINWEKKYSSWGAYAMSKLANTLFVRELVSRQGGAPLVKAVLAHPGYIQSELTAKGPAQKGSRLGVSFFNLTGNVIAQSADMGALPVLYAAASPFARHGGYYGPGGPFHMRGYPSLEKPGKRARSDADARRLWELSLELTDAVFPF